MVAASGEQLAHLLAKDLLLLLLLLATLGAAQLFGSARMSQLNDSASAAVAKRTSEAEEEMIVMMKKSDGRDVAQIAHTQLLELHDGVELDTVAAAERRSR